MEDRVIMDNLESLEEKIENIKWLITHHFSIKRAGGSEAINLIRKSAGILSKGFSRGTVFENKMRREWEASSHKGN